LSKTRLEAFSDAVLAIIITIMVLEMRAPHGTDLPSLKPLIPVFLSYVMSFAYLGIYWNNHHHLLQAASRVTGRTLWANLHLLFWLSLIPFVTRWMGENHFAPYPVALYGLILLLSGLAYYILAHNLIAAHGRESTLAQALGKDFKAKVSLALYAVAIVLALKLPLASCAVYAAVALIWLVPDRRIETKLAG
jgi:uncharacterized membrane protein